MGAPASRGRRVRSAAVALVLVAGVAATVATTSGPERCPNPPAEGEVSDFYGPQDYELGMGRLASPSAFTAGGFHVGRAQVNAPACITAADATVQVTIDLDLDIADAGPVPEDALRTFTLSDGLGRTWTPVDVDSRSRLPPSSEGGDPYRSYATVWFDLPVDIASPVSLDLGQLGDATLEELLLSEPLPSPGTS